jgi:hypothetical protein
LVCAVPVTVLLLPTERPLQGFICLAEEDEEPVTPVDQEVDTPISQEFDQEAESGDIEQSFDVS